MRDRSDLETADRPGGPVTRLVRGLLRPFRGPTASVVARPSPRTGPAKLQGRIKLLCIGADVDALSGLDERLSEDMPQIELVAAVPSDQEDAARAAGLVVLSRPGVPGRQSAVRWLADASPDVILWHGPLRESAPLAALADIPCPAIAVDVPEPEQRDRRTARQALGHLRRTLAQHADAAQTLRRIGPPGTRIEIAGRFTSVPQPPACESAERDALARILNARPIWLAASVPEAELDMVLDAHRTVLRGAHRLLLIVVPDDLATGAGLAGALREEGWQVARRNGEGEPGDGTEIFVADAEDELGLWYRLAPVTYLGGSFGTGPVADPMGPASLGSAILCGPAHGARDTPGARTLALLEGAGGMVSLDSEHALAPTVSDLLAPDKAAALAHAAWDVASDGARVQERVVAALRDALRAASG